MILKYEPTLEPLYRQVRTRAIMHVILNCCKMNTRKYELVDDVGTAEWQVGPRLRLHIRPGTPLSLQFNRVSTFALKCSALNFCYGGQRSSSPSVSERRGGCLEMSYGLVLESHGQDLALTALCVPYIRSSSETSPAHSGVYAHWTAIFV